MKTFEKNLKDIKAMHIDSRGNLYMFVKAAAGIIVCQLSLGLNQFNLINLKILQSLMYKINYKFNY